MTGAHGLILERRNLHIHKLLCNHQHSEEELNNIRIVIKDTKGKLIDRWSGDMDGVGFISGRKLAKATQSTPGKKRKRQTDIRSFNQVKGSEAHKLPNAPKRTFSNICRDCDTDCGSGELLTSGSDCKINTFLELRLYQIHNYFCKVKNTEDVLSGIKIHISAEHFEHNFQWKYDSESAQKIPKISKKRKRSELQTTTQSRAPPKKKMKMVPPKNQRSITEFLSKKSQTE